MFKLGGTPVTLSKPMFMGKGKRSKNNGLAYIDQSSIIAAPLSAPLSATLPNYSLSHHIQPVSLPIIQSLQITQSLPILPLIPLQTVPTKASALPVLNDISDLLNPDLFAFSKPAKTNVYKSYTDWTSPGISPYKF